MLMRTVKMAHEAESLHGIGLARPPLIKNAEALLKAWIIGRICSGSCCDSECALLILSCGLYFVYTCNTYLYVLEYIQVYARDNVGWGLCAMWRRLLEENLRLGTASAVLAGTHLFLVKVSLPCGGTNPTTLILPLAYPHVNLIDRRA